MQFCITPIPSISFFLIIYHSSDMEVTIVNCTILKIKKGKKKHSQVRIFETALKENSIRAKVEDNEKFLYSSINGSKTHEQHQISVQPTYIHISTHIHLQKNKLHTRWNSLLLPFGCMFLILPLPFFYFTFSFFFFIFCFPSIALYRLQFFFSHFPVLLSIFLLFLSLFFANGKKSSKWKTHLKNIQITVLWRFHTFSFRFSSATIIHTFSNSIWHT